MFHSEFSHLGNPGPTHSRYTLPGELYPSTIHECLSRHIMPPMVIEAQGAGAGRKRKRQDGLAASSSTHSVTDFGHKFFELIHRFKISLDRDQLADVITTHLLPHLGSDGHDAAFVTSWTEEILVQDHVHWSVRPDASVPSDGHTPYHYRLDREEPRQLAKDHGSHTCISTRVGGGALGNTGVVRLQAAHLANMFVSSKHVRSVTSGHRVWDYAEDVGSGTSGLASCPVRPPSTEERPVVCLYENKTALLDADFFRLVTALKQQIDGDPPLEFTYNGRGKFSVRRGATVTTLGPAMVLVLSQVFEQLHVNKGVYCLLTNYNVYILVKLTGKNDLCVSDLFFRDPRAMALSRTRHDLSTLPGSLLDDLHLSLNPASVKCVGHTSIDARHATPTQPMSYVLPVLVALLLLDERVGDIWHADAVTHAMNLKYKDIAAKRVKLPQAESNRDAAQDNPTHMSSSGLGGSVMQRMSHSDVPESHDTSSLRSRLTPPTMPKDRPLGSQVPTATLITPPSSSHTMPTESTSSSSNSSDSSTVRFLPAEGRDEDDLERQWFDTLAVTTQVAASAPLTSNPAVTVGGLIGQGWLWDVYEGSISTQNGTRHVVVKICDSSSILHDDERLEQQLDYVYNEARVLKQHLGDLQGTSVPVFFGLYRTNSVDSRGLSLCHIAVLEHCGVPAAGSSRGISALNRDDKRSLCTIFDAIHARRVCHHDIRPRHILRRPDGSLALIDFDHAQADATDSMIAMKDDELQYCSTAEDEVIIQSST